MSGIRPEMFDYNKAVDKADATGFDWNALAQSTQDPGFGSLPHETQQHVWSLLQVKTARNHGERLDPYAPTGELGALRQLGSALKQFFGGGQPDVGAGPAEGTAAATAWNSENKDRAITEYVNEGYNAQEAEKARQEDIKVASGHIAQQFGYYLTGGAIPAPEENKDVFIQHIMDTVVKPATMIGAVGTQFATGNFLLGLVSKVPMISGIAENLSHFTRLLIKGGVLDFGINAAYPEGLSLENRLGVSDNISRMIAPQSVLENPSGAMGRVVAGVGGAVEGALLMSAIGAFSTGVKLADAKYAFTIKPEMLERMKKSLEAAGQDVSGMTRKDIMMSYRTRMTQHIQGFDEAAFNGERQSAESWVAQQFLSDPNITELTTAEGRLLYATFSTNKGGVSVLKGITDPEAALTKLRKVGINVDATILPRRNPAGVGVSNSDVPFPVASDAELDAAVDLAPGVGAKNAQTGEVTSQETLGQWWNDLSDEAKNNIAGVKAKDKVWSELDSGEKAQFEAWFNDKVNAGDVNVPDKPITDINQAARDARDISRLTRGSAIDEVTAPAKPKRVRATKAQLDAANERALHAERRAADAERKASTDGLTGINNQGAWKSAQPRIDADPNLEVVSIDLANFKILNDKAGHEAGDMILQQVAASLKQTTDELGKGVGAQVFRVGGDEFVMVVPKGKGRELFEKAKGRFGSHLVEMRAGVGSTYKEADAAERSIRVASKVPEDEQLAAKLWADAPVARGSSALGMESINKKWEQLTPAEKYKWFSFLRVDEPGFGRPWDELRITPETRNAVQKLIDKGQI